MLSLPTRPQLALSFRLLMTFESFIKFSAEIRQATPAEGKNPQRLSSENLEEPSYLAVPVMKYFPP